MRVLLDNGVPRGIAEGLWKHVVEEARARGWDTLSNGELLDAAEAAGFGVVLTTDRSIPHQQNLSGRLVAVVIIGNTRWRLIREHLAEIATAVEAAAPGTFTEVEIPGG